MFKCLGANLVAVVLVLTPSLAASEEQDESVCTDRERVRASLISQWGELPAVVGRTGNEVMEVWLNPQTGTWTLVITTENGESCIGAAGREGQVIEENPVLSSPTETSPQKQAASFAEICGNGCI